MNVLLTGSNGFLGSSLAERILEKTDFNLRCLVRPGSSISKLERSINEYPDRCQVVYGPLSDYSTCLDALKGIDIVFHLASAKGGAAAEMFQGSSVTTKILLRAINDTENNIKLVHCSSFSVYGVSELDSGAVLVESVPVETKPHRRDLYSYTKWHQECLVRDYCSTHSIPLVVLRPGVVYGPGGTPISTRVGLNLFGLFLFIGGSNPLPLTYVRNCADAFWFAAKNAQFSNDIYNVVDDDLVTAKEFLSLYRKKVNKIRYIKVPYSVMWVLSVLCEKYFIRSKGQLPDVFTRFKTASMWKKQSYSNYRLKQLGWMPEIPTNEGLLMHMNSISLPMKTIE